MPHKIPWERNYHPHFTNEEIDAGKLSNVPRVTQLPRRNCGHQTKVYPTGVANPVLFCYTSPTPKKRISENMLSVLTKASHMFKLIKLLADSWEVINYMGNICRKKYSAFLICSKCIFKPMEKQWMKSYWLVTKTGHLGTKLFKKKNN